MSGDRPKVVVVMPAYNAAKTLHMTYADLPHEVVDLVIVVDDGSSDETAKIAHELGLELFIHNRNYGYGANQKTCYREALKAGADIVVMVHPDYQYDPKIIRYFADLMSAGYYDVMLGTRIRSRREALAGGMPPYKYLANRLTTFCQNIISGQNLSEWHTGMRAYTRDVLAHVPFDTFSDDFVFDSEMLFAIIERDYTIGEISVPVRYFQEASSINIRRSITYGLATVGAAVSFLMRRAFRKTPK